MKLQSKSARKDASIASPSQPITIQKSLTQNSSTARSMLGILLSSTLTISTAAIALPAFAQSAPSNSSNSTSEEYLNNQALRLEATSPVSNHPAAIDLGAPICQTLLQNQVNQTCGLYPVGGGEFAEAPSVPAPTQVPINFHVTVGEFFEMPTFSVPAATQMPMNADEFNRIYLFSN